MKVKDRCLSLLEKDGPGDGSKERAWRVQKEQPGANVAGMKDRRQMAG